MSKFVNYNRIVVYQPRNGWVCDLGPGRSLEPQYQTEENYFETAGGTKKAISRTRSLFLQVFDEENTEHLRKMWHEGCEMRLIALGNEISIVWEVNSEFNFVEVNGGVGGLSGAVLRFHNDLYHCSIYQSKDVLSGIPWVCQDAVLDDDGSYYFPGPSNWQGNRWLVSSGDSTDEDGAFTGSGAPQLTMYFPVEGAGFTLGGTFTGNIKTLDFSGATLTTTSKAVAGTDVTGTIDDGTWKIQVNVTTASTRPELTITSTGSLHAPRVGGCIDCTDLDAELSVAPSWTS